jgi:hypothetical protein
MLLNVYVDLVGNAGLVFVRENNGPNCWGWSLTVEDPATGQPFHLLGSRHDAFADAAREAWQRIASLDWFDIRPAIEGLPAVTDVWRRAFGPSFSHVINLVETGKGEVSGVAVISYYERTDVGSKRT